MNSLITAMGGNPLLEPHPVFAWQGRAEAEPVTLLGSMHTLPASGYPLPQALIAAYSAATALVLEHPLEATEQVVPLKQLPAGAKLSEHLPADLWDSVKSLAGDFGLGIQRLDGLQPWACALEIAAAGWSAGGANPARGVDRHFLERAEADGKKVFFLERVEDGIGALAGSSWESQLVSLRSAVEFTPVLRHQVLKLTQAWRNGDTLSFEETILRKMQENGELYRRVLVDRNRAWEQKITRLIDARPNPTLVVVGCLHLLGRHSLLALLQAHGFSFAQLVEPGGS